MLFACVSKQYKRQPSEGNKYKTYYRTGTGADQTLRVGNSAGDSSFLREITVIAAILKF